MVVKAAAHDQAECYRINVNLKVPNQKSQTTRMRVTEASTMKQIMKVWSEQIGAPEDAMVFKIENTDEVVIFWKIVCGMF